MCAVGHVLGLEQRNRVRQTLANILSIKFTDSSVANSIEMSGKQGPGLEVWRVFPLPEGGLGAKKVPYGTHLDACPADASEMTKLLYALNYTVAELSLEEGKKRFKAFGFKI